MEQPSISFFQIPIYVVEKEAEVVETNTAEEETAALKWWAEVQARKQRELTEEQEEQIEVLKAASLLLQFSKGKRILQCSTTRRVKYANENRSTTTLLSTRSTSVHIY
jgi:hypothetical protein